MDGNHLARSACRDHDPCRVVLEQWVWLVRHQEQRIRQAVQAEIAWRQARAARHLADTRARADQVLRGRP
jgi:hypothetical protein